MIASHWSTNTNRFCLALTFNSTRETLEHIITECASFRETMRNLCNLWLSVSNPHVLILVLDALCNDKEYFMQFLLYGSVLPSVILATQIHGSNILENVFLPYQNLVLCNSQKENEEHWLMELSVPDVSYSQS